MNINGCLASTHIVNTLDNYLLVQCSIIDL